MKEEIKNCFVTSKALSRRYYDEVLRLLNYLTGPNIGCVNDLYTKLTLHLPAAVQESPGKMCPRRDRDQKISQYIQSKAQTKSEIALLFENKNKSDIPSVFQITCARNVPLPLVGIILSQ